MSAHVEKKVLPALKKVDTEKVGAVVAGAATKAAKLAKGAGIVGGIAAVAYAVNKALGAAERKGVEVEVQRRLATVEKGIKRKLTPGERKALEGQHRAHIQQQKKILFTK